MQTPGVAPDSKQKAKGPQPIRPQSSKFEEYLYVNLIFWGFLVLLCVAVYVDCAVSGVIKFGDAPDEVMSQVFKFILLVFGLGFTAVSIFDALYDRFARPEEAEPTK